VFSAFASAFRTPDLRKKLLFTLAILVLYRLGASVPTPNTNTKAINGCINQAAQGSTANIYSLINLFSGGALLRLSAFALGIMPYITASIIIQLLVVVIPRFEQLKQEGQAGQQKLTQYSRYLTIGLAILQSTGFIALARSGQLFPQCTGSILYKTDVFTLATMVLCMTAGTGIIMWLGELVTDRGVGNGMSVLMFTSIAARIPNEGQTILQNAGGFVFTLILALGLAIIVAVVFVEQAQRRIPVQYGYRTRLRRVRTARPAAVLPAVRCHAGAAHAGSDRLEHPRRRAHACAHRRRPARSRRTRAAGAAHARPLAGFAVPVGRGHRDGAGR
jgi:preprotein translocase subunit SecY